MSEAIEGAVFTASPADDAPKAGNSVRNFPPHLLLDMQGSIDAQRAITARLLDRLAQQKHDLPGRDQPRERFELAGLLAIFRGFFGRLPGLFRR